MRVGIYCRVSTLDQNNELQLRDLSAYAAARSLNGWEVFRVYQDQISGARASRPGLDALMADAQARRLDVVIVWKLDRFGRSLVDTVANIDKLTRAGVRFLAITQGIDTDESNPAARFFLQILAAAAEFEREIGRERQRAGIAGRRLKGLHMGRLPKVFRRDLVLELRGQGVSVRRIARELKLPPSTVYDCLKASGKVAAAAAGADEAKAAPGGGPAGASET